jgi:hypothetical protein
MTGAWPTMIVADQTGWVRANQNGESVAGGLQLGGRGCLGPPSSRSTGRLCSVSRHIIVRPQASVPPREICPFWPCLYILDQYIEWLETRTRSGKALAAPASTKMLSWCFAWRCTGRALPAKSLCRRRPTQWWRCMTKCTPRH